MRHTSLRVLAAMLLAAVFAAPVSAVTTGGAAQETISGIIEVAQVELGDGADHFAYTLRSSRAITRLEFAQGNARSLAGSRASVTGTRANDAFRVRSAAVGRDVVVRERATAPRLGTWATETSSTQLTGGATTQAAAEVAAKRIAVVMFNFSDMRTTPFTKAQAQAALLDSTTSAKRFFEEESKGRMTVTGAVFGWYPIAAATTDCNWSSWTTLATNAANAAGANLAAYTNVIFIFPSTSACPWSGLGYVPGAYSYLNGTISGQVMTHELGHNFGLAHANADDCSVSGTRVMIAAPGNCATVGYADPFSTMGNNALRHDHGSHLGELGWLDASEKAIAVPGHSYTITPYFGGTGLKLVRVPRGDGSFFDLDLRTPYGSFDTYAAGSPAVAGVTIRLGVGTASPTTQPQATLLLDSTPATGDLKDAPLLVGKTMNDPVSRLSITAMSLATGGIVVRVREPNAPTAPGSLAADTTTGAVVLTWTPATDDTVVAGYAVKRDGAPAVTTGAGARGWTDPAAAPGTHTYTVAAVDGSANTGPAASVQATLRPASPAPTATPRPPASPNPSATASPRPTATPAPTASPRPTATSGPTASPRPTATPAPTASPRPSAPPVHDAQAPTTPKGLTGVPTTTTVALRWAAASDNTGVVGYRVTRNGTLVASPAGLAWKDTARRPRTTYRYSVAALDAVGNVSSETTITVTTLPDRSRPTTPRWFHRVSRSGVYVTFDWRPSTDNVGVYRYYVYRAGRSAPVAVTRYSKIRIRTVRGASYFVRALDAAGNRSYRSAIVVGRR